MEPPRPHVSRRSRARPLIARTRAEPADAASPAEPDLESAADVRPPVSAIVLAGTVAAAVLAATSIGDALFLGVLLGVAGGGVVPGAVGVLAGVAVLVRWGSSSLAALAGAQSVLGAAVTVGPVVAAASSWCAGLALVAAAPPSSRSRPDRLDVVRGLPFGLAAAAVAAGPGLGGAVVVRVAASVLAVGAAVVVPRALGAGRARAAALALAGASVVLAVVS